MKSNKIQIYIILSMNFLSLCVLCVIFYFGKNYFKDATNLVIGFILSGMLTLMMSIVSYFNEKAKIIKEISDFMEKIIPTFKSYLENEDMNDDDFFHIVYNEKILNFCKSYSPILKTRKYKIAKQYVQILDLFLNKYAAHDVKLSSISYLLELFYKNKKLI